MQQVADTGAVDMIIPAAGLILLGVWLVKTSYGSKALDGCLPRANSMPLYLPFIPLMIWFAATAAASAASERFLGEIAPWKKVAADNIILAAGAVAAIAVILHLARSSFAEKLKGFGLDPRNIHRDFAAAVVNLLAISPVVTLAVVLTITAGEFFGGEDFTIPRHAELDWLRQHPRVELRVLIVAVTIFVVPVFEEMLFRGLFQTVVRNLTISPWPAIAIGSLMFAAVHPAWQHWPALFMLSVCLGYSYEKSGSLFRPIFIHSLFNAASVAATLYGGT
jgi:membrane protease YdiL (CAAX protease family)